MTKDDRDDEASRIHRDLETVCHDVNSALAAVTLCVDFLADCTGAEAPAVDDARLAIGQIVRSMTLLREVSDRVAPATERSRARARLVC